MQFDLLDYKPPGQTLRDQGMARVEANNHDWVSEARKLAIQIAGQNGEVTSDDIQKIMPRPDWVNPNSVGSIFRSKSLRLIGYKQSDRTSAHARRIGIYQYTGVA